MTEGKLSGEISPDGRKITCRSTDGSEKWSKGPPSLKEWRQLGKHQLEANLNGGKFQYAGSEVGGKIFAVFTPAKGLDFNLSYNANTGELIRIDEAR